MITDAINIERIKQMHFQVLRAVFSISYKVVSVLQKSQAGKCSPASHT